MYLAHALVPGGVVLVVGMGGEAHLVELGAVVVELVDGLGEGDGVLGGMR